MTDRGAGIFFTLLLSLCALGLMAETSFGQDPSTRRRIVNGEPADIREHGWQVALSIKSGGVTYACGGSLITKNWLLTAAHCFDSSAKKAGVRAKAGVSNYRSSGNWIEAERIIIHSDYNRQTQKNDIALVKLKSPAPGTTIRYADPTTVPPVNEKLEVTGWGATAENGSASDELMKANVPYVDNSTCNEKNAYKGKISAGMMCAGYAQGGTDACQGDSGGPLVWRKGKEPILVGIVSFGEGCARQLKFGVYTRVSFYHRWIASNLVAAGE